MNMSEMGEIHAYLLRHRIAESTPQDRRRRSTQTGLISERDVCVLLNEADEEQLQQLRSFLSGQGLTLGIYNSGDYPGIPAGGKIYMLLRDPESDLPAIFSQQQLMHKLKIRSDSQEAVALWFIHCWMLMLGLLYTRNNRALSDVSLYQDALFSIDELADNLRTHLETLRREGQSEHQSLRQLTILLSEKGEDINRRCRNFIDVMIDAGHLVEKQKNIYQQTLLGALEAEQSGLNHLKHIIPDEITARIVNLVSHESPVRSSTRSFHNSFHRFFRTSQYQYGSTGGS